VWLFTQQLNIYGTSVLNLYYFCCMYGAKGKASPAPVNKNQPANKKGAPVAQVKKQWAAQDYVT